MSRFAVFYSLALFHISYAPAQAGDTEICQIKHGKFEYHARNVSHTFDEENAFLYLVGTKVHNTDTRYEMELRKGKNKRSDKFTMAVFSTVVTKDSITVGYSSETTTITLYDGMDTFALYERFLPLGDFSDDYLITQVLQDDKELAGVTHLKSKPTPGPNKRLFAALNCHMKPFLIFPNHFVVLPVEEASDVTLSFFVDTIPDMKVTISFMSPAHADKFKSHLRA